MDVQMPTVPTTETMLHSTATGKASTTETATNRYYFSIKY